MPKKADYEIERVTFSAPADLIKRLRELTERSPVSMVKVFERGLRREVEELERLYPPEKH